MSRTCWTEKMVEQEIKEVMRAMNIDRMPSRSEIELIRGDTSLTNKITKTGGFYFWANKLGLEIKNSETKFGYEIEKKISEKLAGDGYSCILTSIRHPYDILVDGCVKIDVKSAKKTRVKEGLVYSFNLEKKEQTCDVYVAVCLGDEESIEKIYVIPAHIMTGKKQLCLGVKNSIYDSYIDRWDIIEKLALAFKQNA